MKHIMCWMMPNIKRNVLNVDRWLNCVWIYVRGSCLACVKYVKVKYLMNNAFELYDCRMGKLILLPGLTALESNWEKLMPVQADWSLRGWPDWLLPRLTEACGADLRDASCPGCLRPVGANRLMPLDQADWGLWGGPDWCLLSRLTEARGADRLMPPDQADWGLWGWSDRSLLSRLTEAHGADRLMPPDQADWGRWGWSDWCLLSRLTEACGADRLMPPDQADWGLWGWSDWCLLSRLTEACGAGLIDASCPGWLRPVGLIWLMPPVQADWGLWGWSDWCLLPRLMKPVGLDWWGPPVQAKCNLWGRNRQYRQKHNK